VLLKAVQDTHQESKFQTNGSQKNQADIILLGVGPMAVGHHNRQQGRSEGGLTP